MYNYQEYNYALYGAQFSTTKGGRLIFRTLTEYRISY